METVETSHDITWKERNLSFFLSSFSLFFTFACLSIFRWYALKIWEMVNDSKKGITFCIFQTYRKAQNLITNLIYMRFPTWLSWYSYNNWINMTLTSDIKRMIKNYIFPKKLTSINSKFWQFNFLKHHQTKYLSTN